MRYLIIANYDAFWEYDARDYTGQRLDIAQDFYDIYNNFFESKYNSLYDAVIDKYKNDYDLIILVDDADITIWEANKNE